MQQNRNLLIFFILSFALFVGVTWLRNHLWPQPKKAAQKDEVVKPRDEKKPEVGLTKLPPQPPVTPAEQLLRLGDPSPDSAYHLALVLDRLGAGVRKIVVNKFEQATEGGLPAGEQLSLVPAGANLHEPSYVLYHFDPDDSKLDHPLDTLGRTVWKVVPQNGKAVLVEHVDGKERQSVAFRAEVQGVTITKTYSLTEGEYHVGLKVDIEYPAAPRGGKSAKQSEVKFRYQLAGAKGLPIEGRWYTTTYRHALIGTEDDRGNLYRDLQDIRQISVWGGGNRVEPKEGQTLRYAAVAVQYFASVIVVDEQQEDQRFLRRAQASLETAVARGRLKGGNLQAPDRLVMQSEDGKFEETIYIPPHLRGDLVGLKEGTLISVVYRPLTYDEQAKQSYKEALSVHIGDDAAKVHSLWEDDVTVRVTTNAIDLKPGSKVTHRYLLYNGPVKPSLLGQLRGEKKVDRELVDRYAYTLQLNTMTDYHSPGWISEQIFNRIRWTWLIIQCTNLMHHVLGFLHLLVSSYGLCIIFLTVLVRGLMFPLSRKQALMGVKMQALAPELKKLQEKYKDDKQALGMAQWELYKKHGVSPFGSCWVMLLQMPVFMGLYYALQESIQFRLAPFWPTWIKNLAAPDMLFRWGESIPLISRPEDFGSMFYLGPYLNILPIIAVALMIMQQKMMLPPPTDEQQAMQQKMMKWMMLLMGFFFYKVAAGLCIYFIATTLWGFAERKLLPKAQLQLPQVGVDFSRAATSAPAGSEQVTKAPAANSGSPNIMSGRKPPRGKRKAERGRTAIKEAEPTTGLGRLMKRLSDWWSDVLEQARKK
jgi:YidC/Oxa1 family membrane protein insertase